MALTPDSSHATASASAWTLLSTTTLSGAGTFDVSSISGAYNDLKLILIARGSDAGTSDRVLLRLNNDSTAIYYHVRDAATAAAAAVVTAVTDTSIQAGLITAAGATANGFGTVEITLFGYASTTWSKTAQWQSFGFTGLTASSLTETRGGGLWNSTAAITRVQLFGNTTANLVTGSQLRIYGRL